MVTCKYILILELLAGPIVTGGVSRSIQKQLAFMLGRQQVCLELDENVAEGEDLAEIMANAHLNNHFLNLAREASQQLVLQADVFFVLFSCPALFFLVCQIINYFLFFFFLLLLH